MTNLAFLPIFILILSIIGAIVLVIVFLVHKQNINKKLIQDKENIQQGKAPSGAGRHNTSVLPIISFILALIALTVSIIFYVNSKTNAIENDINYANNRINTLINEISSLELQTKKASSILTTFKVTDLPDTFDTSTMTEQLKIEIVPKETSNDTTITLKIDSYTYTATKENTVYQVIYEKDIFSEFDDKDSIIVYVTNNGVTKSEIIDSSLYYTINLIKSPIWGTLLPNIDGFNYLRYDNEPKLEDNTFEINYSFDITINKEKSDVTKFVIKIYDGTKVIYENDLTSRLNNHGYYYMIEGVKIRDTWNNIESNYVDLVYEITETNGLTICTHERTCKTGFNDFYLPYYTITSPDGKTYNFK